MKGKKFLLIIVVFIIISIAFAWNYNELKKAYSNSIDIATINNFTLTEPLDNFKSDVPPTLSIDKINTITNLASGVYGINCINSILLKEGVDIWYFKNITYDYYQYLSRLIEKLSTGSDISDVDKKVYEHIYFSYHRLYVLAYNQLIETKKIDNIINNYNKALEEGGFKKISEIK